LLILSQALMTDYELGVMKAIPVAMHLMADYVIGALLIVAPFVLGVSSRSSTATVLLVVMGLLALGAAAMTQPRGRPREVMP
jgi:VIT1/CCC1 family predicted Fe2+/Mn2+ transporter